MISDSLLASARVVPASSAARVGRRPDGAGDAVEHHVARPRRRPRRWPPRRARGTPGANSATCCSNSSGLAPPAVSADDPEPVGVGAHQVEGLGADRPGRAEDDDVAWLAHAGHPRASRGAACGGAARRGQRGNRRTRAPARREPSAIGSAHDRIHCRGPTGGPALPQERRLVTEIPGPGSLRAARPQEGSTSPTGSARRCRSSSTAAGGGVLVDVDGNSLIDLGSGIAVTTRRQRRAGGGRAACRSRSRRSRTPASWSRRTTATSTCARRSPS